MQCKDFTQVSSYSKGYFDADGKVCSSTPLNNRYSYQEFVLWKRKNCQIDSNKLAAEYSDRLYQFDSDKYNKLCIKYFGNSGQMWYEEREPDRIESFLQEYLEKPIKLAMVLQGCNRSNGYPYWVFQYYYSSSLKDGVHNV